MTPERHDDAQHIKSDPSRLCACGCGMPTGRATANSKYRFECAKRLEKERNKRYRETRLQKMDEMR